MIYKLVIPETFEAGEQLRVLEWRAGVGDAVVRGQLLVELETFKTVLEVRTGQDAFVRRILCNEGEWERVGRPFALLSDLADEPLPDSFADVALLEKELQFF